MRLLFAASLRHLARHPAQLALALLGLALGVGALTAVDIATASAGRAFELSLDAANGAATHQIVGGAAGLDERIYADLRTRRLGLELAPVVEGYVVAGDRAMQLLGIDPLVDERVRGRSSIGETGIARTSSNPSGASGREAAGSARRWLLEPGAVALAARTADQLELQRDSRFEISVDGQLHDATVISTLGRATAGGFDNLILTDIAQAQEWLGLTGRLSRIDVRVPVGVRGVTALEHLRRLLPASVQLVETQRRAQQSLDMSRAFTINLQAMSLLGLLVSVFLIYSAVSFAMVQRRQTFGLLRAIGATRGNLFAVTLGEAALLGIVGTAIGIALGLIIARGLIALVAQTINDLYFVVAVSEVVLPSLTVLKAIGAGLLVTLLATALPVAEVVNDPPRVGIRRSALERRAENLSRLLAWTAAFLAIAAVVTAIASHRSLFAGFAALLMLLLAVAALAPAALKAGAVLTARAFATKSAIARIAVSGIAQSLSRTGVAVAALAMAVAAMIGVAVMVDSFRESLRGWLERSLHADFYVSAPGPGFARPERKLEPAAIHDLLATPGIRDHSAGRHITVESERGPVVLDAVTLAASTPPPFELTVGDPHRVWREFAAGALVISEPLAWRLDLAPGARFTLITADGPVSFPIAGVYREYGNDRGNALISREVYRRQWHDDAITVLGLYLAPDVAAAGVESALRHTASAGQALLVRSNRELRDLSMSIFDRTFVITRVLNWLAAGVAAIALSSALLAWQLERSRELAVLRSLGLTPRGAALLIELQTAFMGFVTFLAAVPAGLATAVLLIEVINRRAFGWHIALHPTAPQFGNALALALTAALIAGLFPAWRAGRAPLAADLREE
jgi:putative ABC transport system permease protein